MLINRKHLSLVIALVLIGVGVMFVGCLETETESGTTTTSTPTTSTQTSSPGRASAETLQKIKDATVLVDVTLTDAAGEGVAGTGSGFVISEKGRIITNCHVVRNWQQDEDGSVTTYAHRAIEVIFHPNTDKEKSYPAEVVRENHEVDLALIKIDIETPAFFKLGDSEAAVETTPVMACGHPLGFPEISIRTGTVTAHRNWEGVQWLEHDTATEPGNSGGPVVNVAGEVLGVHSQSMISESMSSKMAIPANVVREWLASNPSSDPGAPEPGGSLEDLFAASGLNYAGPEDGVFVVGYENDVNVFVHTVGESLVRFVVPLGEFASNDGMAALHFNYSDPVGRLSLNSDQELYWEAQVPASFVTGPYIASVCNIAANQAGRWVEIAAGGDPKGPAGLYPGGDDDALTAQLKGVLDSSGLEYEEDDGTFEMAWENDVDVYVNIYKGVAYIHSFTGGMPGGDEAGMASAALEALERNWTDPLGRLALDKYDDMVWESQVPMEFLTPDYLAIIAEIGATQVKEFWGEYGQIPFNEETSGDDES